MNNVSLIIPTYKNPEYLDLCLKSAVENREDDNNDIIVVVDGFYELSETVLKKYKDDILCIVLEENKGMQTALNAGVAQCGTPLIFVINDDNVLPPMWDSRLLTEWECVKEATENNPNVVLTVNQVEPEGPSMFQFPIHNYGKTVAEFDYAKWLLDEPKLGKPLLTVDGHIFPFMMEKKHYMAIGGFDTLYSSPQICDWDFFLKLELLHFEFFRTHYIHLYHFGSTVVRKGVDAEAFKKKEQIAHTEYMWKWGVPAYNEMGTNSKISPITPFRGFIV